jgi:hypothetical protein
MSRLGQRQAGAAGIGSFMQGRTWEKGGFVPHLRTIVDEGLIYASGRAVIAWGRGGVMGRRNSCVHVRRGPRVANLDTTGSVRIRGNSPDTADYLESTLT